MSDNNEPSPFIRKVEDRPYVIFEAVRNRGMDDEYKDEFRCDLTDRRGSPTVWAQVEQMRIYLAKGWKPIGMGGNFDKTPNLKDIQSFVSPLIASERRAREAEGKLKEVADGKARSTKVREPRPETASA